MCIGPVVPTIETAVKVSDTQYNKFTVILQPEVFNDANGPVLYYGVLVHADTTGMSIRCLFTPYNVNIFYNSII